MVRNSTFVEAEGKNCAVVNILGFFLSLTRGIVRLLELLQMWTKSL